jgi:hypothetical protein
VNLQDWLTQSMGSEVSLPADVPLLPDGKTPASATDQDFIDAYTAYLLSRPVVSDRLRGSPQTDSEAAAIFESVVLNFMMRPRAVLYIAHLARNSLVKSINDELALITEVENLIKDFTNISFLVKDTTGLTLAKTALIQIENQGRLGGNSAVLTRFEEAVAKFLEELGKSVRGTGTEMLRPSSEAESYLPTSYAKLVSTHKDTSSRLLSLSTGIDGFFSSPVGSLLCMSTVQTIRDDVENLLEEFQNNPSSANARDAVYRLVSARAVLRTMSTPPAWDDPIRVSGSSAGGTSLVLSDLTSGLQPGDVLAGKEVLSVDGDDVLLGGSITPFDGVTTAQSGLALMWTALRAELGVAVQSWQDSGFSEGLGALDEALAGLTASSATTKTSLALRILGDLRAALEELATHLTTSKPRSVLNEKRVVDGVLTTLSERGYDRAVAVLLSGRVEDIFYMDWQSASYAGNLMKAASGVAQNDVKFPNKELDERPLFSHRGND